MDYTKKLYDILTDKTLSKKEIIIFIFNRRIKLEILHIVNSEIIRNYDKINWYRLPMNEKCRKKTHDTCVCHAFFIRPTFPF